MTGPLTGKTALITGAGRGIGAATAQLFANQGAKVVLTSRTESELRAVEATIKAAGGIATSIVCDVADETEVARLFDRTHETLGGLDILINNAGTSWSGDFASHPAENWDRVMAVNVRGPFLCSREAFRLFKTLGRGGSIVNLSSLAGIRGTEKFQGTTSYVTSKFAIVGLTESLAVEGRALGIRVNCIAPGAVDTEMLRRVAPQLKTRTTPADIAKLLLFLADDRQSGALTGTTLEVYSNA